MPHINDQNLLKTSSYINGKWQAAQSTFSVFNPSNGEEVAKVTNGCAEHTNQAIIAAKAALALWSGKTVNQRAKILHKWCTLMHEHKEDLAHIITLEQGKPYAEAKGEISYGAAYVEWFAEEGKRVYGETLPAATANQRLMVIKQPVGVVAAITPWNFPNAMITRKAAAALAAGCTFVVRPSELTPLSALALAELAHRAGLPDGVFNVVVGKNAQEIGKVLTQHPEVAKFTFTGSTDVGKLLAAQCASTVKKVSLELGGNAPFIVFDDADIDAAVQGAIASKYRNSGQTCICTNRIFLHHSIALEFTEKYRKAVENLVIGDGFDEGSDVGPLISVAAVERVADLVNDALKQGATLICGGERSILGDCFYQPTILANVENMMRIAKNEIFGPVSTLIAFGSDAEVVDLANDTEYGLAAYFYSQNVNRVWRIAEQLNFGMVGINDTSISNVAAPFGGVKQSGYGREGSKHGLEDYLNIKYLSLGGLE